MRMNVINARQLFTTLEGMKQISRLPFAQEDINNYLHTINKINAMQYGMNMLEGFQLTEYSVTSDLSDLIIPSRIQFVVGDLMTDYKGEVYSQPDTLVKCIVLSPLQFNIISHGINSARRQSGKQLTPVSGLRISRTVTEVADRLFLDGTDLCKPLATAYLPIHSKIQVNIPAVYTESIDSMFDRWALAKIQEIKA